MELKYNPLYAKRDQFEVLIVPLWNWNVIVSPLLIVVISFNRTFMELKCGTAIILPTDDWF